MFPKISTFFESEYFQSFLYMCIVFTCESRFRRIKNNKKSNKFFEAQYLNVIF